jgi:hypothetical protein
MKLSPELRAYRHYKKYIDYYSAMLIENYSDNITETSNEIYKEIASKFGADYIKLREIISITYERFVDRVRKKLNIK